MGKKKREHKAKVAKRNFKQEEEAWNDMITIQDALEKKYGDPVKVLEENPELARALSPFALRLVELRARNLKKYGN